MHPTLERAGQLKQALSDFVLEAEGELATALERFVANQLVRSQQKDIQHRTLIVDTFLSRGTVGEDTPIDQFIASEPDLTEDDRQLLHRWKRSFTGLFALQHRLEDGLEVMNWLTAKTYRVKQSDPALIQSMERLRQGEILLTRIAPFNETEWMFFSSHITLGALGKPKLAVAIGNFKDHYKEDLYGDAAELLEEAWQSVERYHQDFLDFFGSDELTLSGYELGKKLTEFQDFITQRQLTAAGMDGSKSLAELAAEAGMSDQELTEAAEAMGVDGAIATKLLHTKDKPQMAAPQVELPPDLKKAEQITVLAHPRWGQVFLPQHSQFLTLLKREDWQTLKGADKLIQKYLDDATVNVFVWQRLAEQYPADLERVLRQFLNRPDFDLQRDLLPLLKEHHKSPDPDLPEIASVPIHLHTLFQEALGEVTKSQTKSKAEKKVKKGFQRL